MSRSVQVGDTIEYDAITKTVQMQVVRVGSDGVMLVWLTDGGGVRMRSRSLVDEDIASGDWRIVTPPADADAGATGEGTG